MKFQGTAFKILNEFKEVFNRIDRKEVEDPYIWLKEFAHISPVIHIQQTDGVLDRHWPFTPEYNKRGIIEPQKVIQAINESEAKEVVLLLEVVHTFEEDENKVLSDIKESVNCGKQVMNQG